MNTNNIDYNELNTLLKDVDALVKRGKVNVVTVNGCRLTCFENGDIIRNFRGMYNKLIENIDNSDGYNVFGCNGKTYRRHRIIAYAFLGLHLSESEKEIDHIDGNRINNKVNNLRIVNHNQNQWNRTKAKGYNWDKLTKKYRARIVLNNKKILLGYFQTEEEAHDAYLKAKLIYHVIS